jgi:hypothetical protein
VDKGNENNCFSPAPIYFTFTTGLVPLTEILKLFEHFHDAQEVLDSGAF